MKALALPDTAIVSAEVVPAGPFTLPTGNERQVSRPLPIPVEACRVTGVISYGAIATALGRGYATASTDTGHSTPGGSWALGRPDLVVDFAYRAVHEVTVKAKTTTEAFYGSGPRLSYFVGCSTGGRQGLMEAQRFPADYDGIVAGAPANYWTHLMAGTLSPALVTLRDPAAQLSSAKLATANAAARAIYAPSVNPRTKATIFPVRPTHAYWAAKQ